MISKKKNKSNFIEELSYNLHNQDVRLTAEPIYIVQEQIRIYGLEEHHADGFVIRELDGFVTKELGNGNDNEWFDPEDTFIDEYDVGFENLYYKNIWKAVTFCLTMEGAKVYQKSREYDT